MILGTMLLLYVALGGVTTSPKPQLQQRQQDADMAMAIYILPFGYAVLVHDKLLHKESSTGPMTNLEQQ